MACDRVSTLFLIAFLLIFAAANPLAHGLGLDLDAPSLTVTGHLCCTADGNCPGNGTAGVVVSLNCPSLPGVSTRVDQNITGVDGFFNITVPSAPWFFRIKPIPPCTATVQLPLNNVTCPELSTTDGVLVSAIRSVGFVFPNIFSRVVNATTIKFVLLRNV